MHGIHAQYTLVAAFHSKLAKRQANLLSIWAKKARHDDSCPLDENENRLEPDERAGGIYSKDSSCPPDSEDENSVIQSNEGSHSNDQPNA